ncbi:hypothetical protein E0Z10_g6866 [Xylaria hypoxylon]|uniref:Enoyl reductase (ER) domain-containing protein n=1 Tax=Xylaria hypoxylon TaxID=37992 RepID=A0A4Z0YRS7_9PEZI|nr:hypothetical protein E0Z10_g6866 [Xylaria hypoxylon]
MSNQADIPKTMKAWISFRAGKPEDVLELKTDWPTPSPPKAGEIMIKVSYVAINPGDPKMIVKPIPFRKSAIAGMDFAGEVIQVGPSSPTSVPNIRLGMIVAGTVPIINIIGGIGSLAEYLVVPAHAVAEKPNGLQEDAAGALFGIVGQTSVILLRAANLQKGDKVLLNGASGGVGCILTQMLCGMGVHVTGICSSKNASLVHRLGAQESIVSQVVDYTAHKDLYEYLKVDGKYHNIERGPFSFIAQFKFNHWPVLLGGIPRTYSGVFSNPAGSSAREVVSWFERGCIKEVPIDSVFEMNDALKAFETISTKRTVGKILIKVK